MISLIKNLFLFLLVVGCFHLLAGCSVFNSQDDCECPTFGEKPTEERQTTVETTADLKKTRTTKPGLLDHSKMSK